MTADPIIPVWSAFACMYPCYAVSKTVLSFVIAWLVLSPIFKIPGTAVGPVPSSLFPFVSASDPKHSVASLAQLTQNELICVIGGHRGQVTTSDPAVVFSMSPIYFHHAEIVAVISIFHPVFFAGFNARFFVASDFKA